MPKKLKGGIVLGIIISALFLVVAAKATDEASVTNLWQKEKNNTLPVSNQIVIKQTNGDIVKVKVAQTNNINNVLEIWNQQQGVDYSELDGLAWALGQETSWGYSTVKAAEAAANNGATGSGVIVAVIDTGVDYNHEDLDANNWVNSDETPSNGVDDDANGYVDDYYGYDFIGNIYTELHPDTDPDDDYGHGTHVSGIIAAENNSVGVLGIAPSATIMPVKVLDASGWGWNSDIAEGIRYAVANGANIINMSLGSYTPSRVLQDAIDYAETNNVLVIAAAGNNNSYTLPSYPAVYANVVSVAASNEDGYKTYYSNWGKVDVMAPGNDIISSTPGNKYTSYSGTSMASPHAAGVAALIMQVKGTNARATRHVLETTATDFGTQSGPDYITGQGMTDALAATGTLSAETFVYADAGWIKSDGSDDTVIYASVRDATATALVGETVTWTTTKGTLSGATSITNANGIASITLTADDTSGLALITATPTNATAGSIQISINSDIIGVDGAGINASFSSSTEEGGEETAEEGAEEETEEVTTLTNNLFAAGDTVYIWAYATAYDRTSHDKVTMSYSVTDSSGNTVSDMSGITSENTVGFNFWDIWFEPQTRFTSAPLTIPDDMANGYYTINIILTDQETSESSTASAHFWVGNMPEVLVVYNSSYCMDTAMQGLDYGGYPICTNTGITLENTITNLGYDAMLWDSTDLGTPYDTDLSLFPVVVWLDAGLTYADSYSLQTYLDNGGNLLLSSDAFAYYDSSSVTSEFIWNYLHAKYVSSLMHPDAVNGVSGGIFDGLTFNTDYFDLNGNGIHNNYYADELELNDEDDAEAILAYNEGDSTAKTAGVIVDTGTFRSAYLSFGLESINDITGNQTKEYVLGTLIDWLLGDGPTVTKATPKKLANNQDRAITIKGSGFITTGTTKVKLGTHSLLDVDVISRNKITATVPAGLSARQYKLKVINPDSSKDTKKKAVTIKKGGAVIESVAPYFIANDKKQTIVITGQNFKQKSKIFLGNERIIDITFDNVNQLTASVPKNFVIGTYTLKVKNPNQPYGQLKKALKIRLGFTKLLRSGDTDAQVLALEKRLKKYGYFEETPDTQFNVKTEEALLLYQKNQILEPSGKMDYLTRYNLNTVE